MNPFTIEIPQADVDDLKRRLAATRYPDEVEDAGWDYGTSIPFLRKLVEHWRTRFDWRKQEARLNGFRHFTTELDGERVHFIHASGAGGNATPILLAKHEGCLVFTAEGTPATASIADEPLATIVASDSAGAEGGADPATFTIARGGAATFDRDVSVVVTGTATYGVDYLIAGPAITTRELVRYPDPLAPSTAARSRPRVSRTRARLRWTASGRSAKLSGV